MRLRILLVTAALCAAPLAQPLVAAAEPVAAGAHQGFYNPPKPLPPGSNGDIIRTEPLIPALPTPAKTTRIMYRSTDTQGAPIAVTGTVLDPVAPWHGPGPRPLVSFAIGTHGMGDQCAPSKLMSQLIHYRPPLDIMAEYETLFIDIMLAQGVAVVVTDYEGLGTPGVHTYLNPVAEAHAVIDAARAAQRLRGSSIPPSGPVAFWGYSQGGGASGGAAELVGSYAPELDVRGSYVGAVPADLHMLFRNLDSTILKVAPAGFLAGLRKAFPDTAPAVDSILNNHGQQLLKELDTQCAAEWAARYVWEPTSVYTVKHVPLWQAIIENPVLKQRVNQLKLGNIRPSAPVLVTTGSNDDIAPPAGARQLARDWCARGATVQLEESPIPTILPGTAAGHTFNAIYLNILEGNQWLLDRFAGKPAPSIC